MNSQSIIIGITGASGSGKTLITKKLTEHFDPTEVAVLSEDRYYKNLLDLPISKRPLHNFDHPDAFDHYLLEQQLTSLRAGKKVFVPQYDYKLHLRKKEAQVILPAKFILLEGILIFTSPALRQAMDIKIFVDTPLDICLLRRLQRDTLQRGRSVQSILEQYQQTVRPMYFKFIEPTKQYADIIIPHGGENTIAMDILQSRIQSMLLQ
ncbi:MAG: uridine kinase [Pseudomonadales bacterium]|nr:uridine kinase [Pseudomonadales bacterium]